MDQPITHNPDSTEDVGGGSPNHVDEPVDSHSPEAGNHQINDSNENREEEPSRDGEDNRRPYEALKVIKEQETHNLYCPKCTCNITQTAQLFEIGREPYPYNNQHFVLWVPLVFPSFSLSLFRYNWGGLWTKLKNLVPNCLTWLSLTSLRFLLVAVLLLLSVIVLWSSPSPSPLPGPISPLPRPGPPSPSPLPGTFTPLPRPDLPSPLPLLGPISPLPQPGPPSPLPLPGPISPLPRPGPPSPSPLPEPISPLPRPGPPSPSPLPEPISPLPLPAESPYPSPRPGPPSPPPPSDPSSPSTQPRRHLSEKIRWVIHFKSIKYLSVLSLLFLAILALPWPSIYFTIIYLIKKIKRVWPPAPTPPRVQLLPPNPDPGLDSDTTPPPLPPPSLPRPPLPRPPPPPVWRRIVVLIQNLIPRELDILKSIVYGGLIESITSLGVVSSAAASGASTLNVLALGLANLFSGLFLIIHSLYGLVTSQSQFQNANANTDPMINVVTEDPYQNLLGNRRKVKLHCFVVLVSFIFFGVIPPLFYGLSFKRTDKGHYKAAVVLAASLVCVISLSFAKAYAFGMRKLKTVAEYTGMAIGASALSFIASQIVADLFEKYGFHELASDYRKG